MSRIAFRSLVFAAVVLLLSGSAGLLAQPTPTPTPGPAAGPGPWSASHPLWIDLNGDGVPQADELTAYPRLQSETCTQVVAYPAGLGPSSSPCAEVYERGGVGGSVVRPNGTVQTLYSNQSGTEFTFIEEPHAYSPPARAGASALGKSGVRTLATASANGTGRLLDLNGDAIFDSLEVEGTRSSTPVPRTRMSLLPVDATGDGRPDYISVPWTTSGAGMLGVLTESTPQVYFPLTDTNADGWPDTITAQVANGGLSTTTGPPLSGSALLNGAPIPSASSLGLFAFAAAVLAVGVKLLRGTFAAS